MENDIESWWSSTESENNEQKIVLHVYDDESREFTSLTTYHGMIRIYTSKTWPSRIFWTVVVVTCLALFMIQGGLLLGFYHSHPTTYKMIVSEITSKVLPAVSICPLGFKHNDYLYEFLIENSYGPIEPSHLDNYSTIDLIENSSYECNDVITELRLGTTKLSCKDLKTVLTDAGVCFKFTNWKEFPTDNIKVVFSSKFSENLLVRVHEVFDNPSEVSKSVWVQNGVTSILSFSVIEKHLLPKYDWGTCEDVRNSSYYSLTECSENCIFDAFWENCNCLPFYNENRSGICTLQQIKNCKIEKSTRCDCPLPCYSQEFTFSAPIVLPNNQNLTILKLQLNSHQIKSYHQYKRFKQVDLMSYVGGVMGLFLGMSCVTLLEVFIFLFKTVFGTLNDTRHQKFIEGLLGDPENELHRSHEEIIITKKFGKNHDTTALLEEEENENEIDFLEHLQNFSKRKMSRISVTNEIASLGSRLYRPSIALRRNSTYHGACDF